MKVCKYFLGAAALLALTGCVDKDPEMHFFPNPDVDFTYAVEGNEYKYDFYVVSTIQFNNTSSSTGNFTWDFGDGTTSNEVSPTHKYEKAGMYKVRLTNEKGYREYPLLIIDITPTLTVKSTSTEIIEFNKTLVDFNMELPNPEHLKVKYEWTFPDGTYTEDGQPLTTFIGYSDENGNIDYHNTYGETKAQAIQRFLMYAVEELHDVGVYVSADVFGETNNPYVTSYGQYWPAISNVVDVISGMPYPDHFAQNGTYRPWEHPYETLLDWGAKAAERQSETPSPAIVRTWIQAYDAIRTPYNTYGAEEIAGQIRALQENGLDGGFMAWNAMCSLSKLESFKPAFDALE